MVKSVLLASTAAALSIRQTSGSQQSCIICSNLFDDTVILFHPCGFYNISLSVRAGHNGIVFAREVDLK